MIKNYTLVALRNILKQKSFSFITISGLAIGMAVCILLALWVIDECETDRFHVNGDDLYLIGQQAKFGSSYKTGATTAPAVGPALEQEYPEVLRAARFTTVGRLILSYGDQVLQEPCHAADPGFLEMFTYPMLKGDSTVALSDPHSILLTEQVAAKFFGDTDPIGKTITIDNSFAYTVTGILAEPPSTSSMRFGVLIPFVAAGEIWRDPTYNTSWTNWSAPTYVQLQPGVSVRDLNSKIADRLNQHGGTENTRLFLVSVPDFYLFGMGTGGGRIGQVILFSAFALALLFIACLNFMNLSTARSSTRAPEIGMRRVVGATRTDIIRQFYGESFLYAFLALLLALGLVELFLPAFCDLAGKQLSLTILSSPIVALSILGITLLTGTVAGSYPALFMASFKPVRILAGIMYSGRRKAGFRKGFVVWQYTVTVVLTVVFLTVFKQLDFMRQVDLGFDARHLVYVELRGELKSHTETVQAAVLADPDIESVTLTSRVPIGVWTNGSGWRWAGQGAGTDPLITYYFTDVNFPETFGTSMVAGDFYLKDREGSSSYARNEVVINESFADILEKDDPIGTRLSNYGQTYTIVGVIKNFNLKSLRHRVDPTIMFLQASTPMSPDRFHYLFARVRPDATRDALGSLERICRDVSPGYPVKARALDDDLGGMYDRERQFGSIIRYLAGLMILVASMGLIGLTSFTTEQRTQEISIRRIMGAPTISIVRMLCRDILTPIVIANIIGAVMAFVFAKGWLFARFAFRTDIGWEPFVIAAVGSLVIALASVSYPAIKAAHANPVDTLRHE